VEKQALIVARSQDEIDMVLNRLLHILLTALPLTLFLAGGGGVFLLRRILNPVEKIISTAREIEATWICMGESLQRKAETIREALFMYGSPLLMMVQRFKRGVGRTAIGHHPSSSFCGVFSKKDVYQVESPAPLSSTTADRAGRYRYRKCL